jgi:hypothetical protein
MELKPFTVIGYFHGNGESMCEHVMANNGIHAFWVAAQAKPTLTMVAAMSGQPRSGTPASADPIPSKRAFPHAQPHPIAFSVPLHVRSWASSTPIHPCHRHR